MVALAFPLDMTGEEATPELIDAVIGRCKVADDAAMHACSTSIDAVLPDDPADAPAAMARDLMDWDEAREMVESGLVRMGSHTRRHTRLQGGPVARPAGGRDRRLAPRAGGAARSRRAAVLLSERGLLPAGLRLGEAGPTRARCPRSAAGTCRAWIPHGAADRGARGREPDAAGDPGAGVGVAGAVMIIQGVEPSKDAKNLYPAFQAMLDVCKAIDRKLLTRRCHKQKDAGYIVVTDRYPGRVPGSASGPRKSPRGNSVAARQLHRIEIGIYASIRPPDLLLRLSAPVELTVYRNAIRDQPKSEQKVRASHEAARLLRFPGVEEVEIDTALPQEESLSRAFSAIVVHLEFSSRAGSKMGTRTSSLS
jgi:hypothetical protein